MLFNTTDITDPTVLDLMEAANTYHADFTALKDKLAKNKPATDAEHFAWLKENPTKGYNAAVKALTPVAMDVTEMAATKEQATVLKKRLLNTIEALTGMAERKEMPTIYSMADAALKSFKTAPQAAKNNENSLIREWAKSQGLKVSEKGKISEEIKAKYAAR